MGFLEFLQGAERQFNPIDGNKTAKNKQGNNNKSAVAQAAHIPFSFLKGGRDLGVGITRAVARIPETVVRSTVQASADLAHKVNPDVNLNLSQPTENTGVKEILYGKEPLQTYQDRTAGNKKVIEGSRFKAAAGPLSFLALAGTVGGDVVPAGKVAKPVFEKGIEDLAKAGTTAEVRNIMKGTPSHIVDKVAPAIAQTKDPNIVKNLLDKHMAPEVSAPAPITDIRPTIPNSSVPVVGPGSAPGPDPFDEILGAVRGQPAAPGQAPVKGLATARAQQDVLLSQQRGQRFSQARENAKGLTGSDAYFKRLAAQKGSYQQVDYHPLIDTIGPQRGEELFTKAQQKIYSTPDDVYHELNLHPDGARLTTEKAVRKVIGLEPGIPTRSELKLLGVYSPQLAEEVKAAMPVHRKIFDAAGILFGNARSIKSSMDFSMGGRQGLFVAARHPAEWARANKESIKYAKSSDYYNQSMREVHGDEWGQFIDSHNKNVLTGGVGHEEAYTNTDIFAGKTAKKAGVGHLVAGSERAYVGGLTKLRKDILVKALRAYGNTPQEVEQALGKKNVDGLLETVATLTGRGGKKGGFTEKHLATLGSALFSPRLWASRLQPLNPAFWNRIGPAGRKEAIQNLGSFAAVAGVVLSAAVRAGADVETDPRSSDFLKIKVGDTRYDILGGFQQNLVFGARELSGSTKSSTTGAITKYGSTPIAPTRLSAAFDLTRNKANPVLSAGANILEGKDKGGNKINPATEIGQLFVPISIQSTYHAAQDEGLKGALKNTPDYVGISTQSYGLKDTNISDKQKAYIAKLSDKSQQEAYTRFLQTAKIASGKRQNVVDDIKKLAKAGDVNKAIKVAKAYNESYNSGFNEWRGKYSKYKDDVLSKQYNKHLISDESFNKWVQDSQGGN